MMDFMPTLTDLAVAALIILAAGVAVGAVIGLAI